MRTIILVLLFTVLTSAYAQEDDYKFSLDKAVTYALEHNYGAINASRDLVDAQKQKWETIATGLPQINGAVSYQNQIKQVLSLIPAEFFGGEAGDFTAVAFSPVHQMQPTVTLSQQIFDGSYIVGVQATKTFIEYTKNNKEKNDIELKKSVVEAYGNALLAQESVIIFGKNKETLEKNLYETEKVFENGLGDEESVDQLKITLSSVDNQLKNAQRMEEITLKMLNVILGLPLNTNTLLTDTLDDLTVRQIDFSLLETQFNIENNIDYKFASNLNDQRKLELKLAKSYALPSLNAFINYGAISGGEDFNFFGSDADWFGYSVLGFDLNIPIFSSLGRSASTQRAKIAYEKAKTDFTQATEQINLQWESAKSDYILAIEQYETSKDNLNLAERIENKNQIKYSEGLATSFELRQAQTQLYSTQQEYLQSMVNVINRKTDLQNVLNQ